MATSPLKKQLVAMNKEANSKGSAKPNPKSTPEALTQKIAKHLKSGK